MKNSILIIIFLLFSIYTFGQNGFTSYQMSAIPQSTYLNPANKFNGKFFIGLTALSSTSIVASNSSFAWSDIVEKRKDSLFLSLNSLLNNLNKNNFISNAVTVDILSFGFKLGKRSTFSFNVTEKINFRFQYPKDFMQFIIEGNASFGDQTAEFNGLGINANHYREYGVNFNKTLKNERLTIGLRLKYLYGMENINTETSDLEIYTDPNTYDISTNSEIKINTSGLSDSIVKVGDYLFGRNNKGYGADFGFKYRLNEKISLNGSVIDLGFIKWNNNVTNYTSQKNQFTYAGIDIDEFILNDTSSANGRNSFDRVLDSLEKAFDIEETNNSYTTSLATQIYFGGKYHLDNSTNIAALAHADFFKGKIKPSLNLSYNKKFKNYFHLSFSYTITNRTFNNFGGGLIFHPGPFQIYVMADNIVGAFKPQNAQYFQLRTGLNLVFGKNSLNNVRRKDRKKAEKSLYQQS